MNNFWYSKSYAKYDISITFTWFSLWTLLLVGEGQHKFRSHYKEKKQSQQTRCESGRAVNKVPVSSATVVTIRNQDGKTCSVLSPCLTLLHSATRPTDNFKPFFHVHEKLWVCRKTVTLMLAPKMLKRAIAQVNYPCTKLYVLNPGNF